MQDVRGRFSMVPLRGLDDNYDEEWDKKSEHQLVSKRAGTRLLVGSTNGANNARSEVRHGGARQHLIAVSGCIVAQDVARCTGARGCTS